MTDIAVQPEVARVNSPPIVLGISESHRDRQLNPFGSWAFTGAEYPGAGILTGLVLKGLARKCTAHRRRCWKRKIGRLKAAKYNISLGQNDYVVNDEVNMTIGKQITRPTRYASSDDFRRVFDEHMNSLYLLAFLLTADQDKAELCFVSGLEDAVEGNPVFKQWAQSWARRAVIRNAARALSPRPEGENGRSQPSSDPVNNSSKLLPSAQPAEIASVLGLEPFERFVYVITVLERYSDQDCAVLLGCMRRDVLAARTHALQELASEAATNYGQQPTASDENRHRGERRNSALQLLATARLASCS